VVVSLNLMSDGERGVMARERERLDPHGEISSKCLSH
jgi:hypothetical protein